MSTTLRHELEHSHATLMAIAPVMPTLESLQPILSDADAADKRGYYLPDEDDRLREIFAQYLEIRSALRSVVDSMEPWVDQGEHLERRERLSVFLVGFTAACFLIRQGHFMIGVAKGKRVVRKKLDEAEPRFGIPRKSFTEIYRLQSSVRRMWKFHEAWTFYDQNKDEIHMLADDPELGKIVQILRAEEPFMHTRRRAYWKHRVRYRLHSFRRRNRSTYDQTMFRLLEFGGRTVAELRDPSAGIKKLPKRVLGEPLQAAAEILEPGDIIVTRHRDALSNVFLPGFWPHVSLYVGDQVEGKGDVMEAKKDGVLRRHLSETLSVDAFVILRAKLTPAVRNEAAQRALTHQGKLYDFSFDFRQSHCLACTALVYQSWHGLGGVSLELGRTSGRMCLPAEGLIEQTLESGTFEVAAYFGPSCETVSLGAEASDTFKKQFYPR